MTSGNPKPKILVTGANGQLGRELHALAKSCKDFDFVFLSRADMPVHHPELVRHFMHTLQPQYLINCGAYTAVDRAETEKDKAFIVNGEAPGILAEICGVNKCRFIHISTDYVFNGEGNTPYKETDATGPKSVYGASKLMGEERALHNNPESIIIRTSWVYSQYGNNFVKTMLRLMNEKQHISVVNDQWGSPTWAAGLAAAIFQLIRKIEAGNKTINGIYHYCDGGITNWHAFALVIKEFTGSPCVVEAIPTSAYPTAAKRPAWSALDTTKIAGEGVQILPWETQLQICLNQLTAKNEANSSL